MTVVSLYFLLTADSAGVVVLALHWAAADSAGIVGQAWHWTAADSAGIVDLAWHWTDGFDDVGTPGL